MNKHNKVAIITGSAQRLGKCIATELHRRNIDIAIHYNQSVEAALFLCDEFNRIRKNSAKVFQADLSTSDLKGPNTADQLIESVFQYFQRIDYLVNNASIFYPTSFIETPSTELANFLQINFFQPVKLLQSAFPYLKKNKGAAVNIIDIYANRGLVNHSDYTASRAALLAATKDLAYRFAPDVRVNGVSPGAILWPDTIHSPDSSDNQAQKNQKSIIDKTALKRRGSTLDISKTVAYLLIDAIYTTGSVINVDGGRRLYI